MYNGPQVYLLRNADLPLSKIGYTRNSAQLRAENYTRGGQWTVQRYWPVPDGEVEDTERELHRHFAAGRIAPVDRPDAPQEYKLEIFDVHPDDAERAIDRMVQTRFPNYEPPRKRSWRISLVPFLIGVGLALWLYYG